MPGRRRGAQLRRQRQDAARRPLSRTSGFSRPPAMPAARSARRSPPTISMQRPRTRGPPTRSTAWRAPISVPSSTRPISTSGCTRCGARFTTRGRRRHARHDRQSARGRARRSAGSRAAWNSGRARSATARSSAIRAARRMQKNLNLKVKYRESFRPFAPSVLREKVAELVRPRRRQPLHAAGRAGRRTATCGKMTRRGRGAVRHRQAQRRALDHPGGHARRLFGAGADRAPRDATRSITI